MRSVYKYGFDKARSGAAWSSEIPFINGNKVKAFAAQK
jgi:hypothetical protein